MQLDIHAAVATKICFASHQNSVPLLRELEILNNSDEAVEDLDLTSRLIHHSSSPADGNSTD